MSVSVFLSSLNAPDVCLLTCFIQFFLPQIAIHSQSGCPHVSVTFCWCPQLMPSPPPQEDSLGENRISAHWWEPACKTPNSKEKTNLPVNYRAATPQLPSSFPRSAQWEKSCGHQHPIKEDEMFQGYLTPATIPRPQSQLEDFPEKALP